MAPGHSTPAPGIVILSQRRRTHASCRRQHRGGGLPVPRRPRRPARRPRSKAAIAPTSWRPLRALGALAVLFLAFRSRPMPPARPSPLTTRSGAPSPPRRRCIQRPRRLRRRAEPRPPVHHLDARNQAAKTIHAASGCVCVGIFDTSYNDIFRNIIAYWFHSKTSEGTKIAHHCSRSPRRCRCGPMGRSSLQGWHRLNAI